jgi:hypothetical protein
MIWVLAPFTPTILTKQVSRPMNQFRSPIAAAEAQQAGRTRRNTCSRGRSGVFVPYRAGRGSSASPAPSISARSFWSLEVGEPFSYAYTSLTLKVLLPDAGRAQGAIPRSRERARGHRPGSVGRRWLVVAARTVAIMAKTGSGDCCRQEAVAPSHGDISWK